MIEHNKSYSKFWKVDEKGNMIDITDECPVAAIEFCKDILDMLINLTRNIYFIYIQY